MTVLNLKLFYLRGNTGVKYKLIITKIKILSTRFYNIHLKDKKYLKIDFLYKVISNENISKTNNP